MPTYDYRCTRCKHRFELFHSITDDAPKRCPRCKARAQRVPAGGAGLLFKGSGFYITDYRSKSYREKARQEKSGEAGEKKKSGGDSKRSSDS
jgi:putative FmdB family regulatory protein